jgi:hypothetical protein
MSFFDSTKAHKDIITDILVNHYNKFLISADSSGKMVIWDFYGAIIYTTIDLNQVS